MVTAILAVALAMGAPVEGADTVIPVSRDVRLDVGDTRGEVVVRAWDRDAVRVQADLSSRQRLEVSRTGTVLRVRPGSIRGGPEDTDIEIQVPRWMDVRVTGNRVDVEVRGTEGEVNVETVGGDVLVEGGTGRVLLRSIQGEVMVRGASGRVEVSSVNEDVSLEDIDGELRVETTNGDVTLRRIRSSGTRATTVNGDITYEGSILANGRYLFSTHNGDVEVTVPESADAIVSVSTFHGEFESEFPVQLTGTTRDRQFNFTLGTGSARIELESFNGEILLRRP